jgi:hypothetical protein
MKMTPENLAITEYIVAKLREADLAPTIFDDYSVRVLSDSRFSMRFVERLGKLSIEMTEGEITYFKSKYDKNTIAESISKFSTNLKSGEIKRFENFSLDKWFPREAVSVERINGGFDFSAHNVRIYITGPRTSGRFYASMRIFMANEETLKLADATSFKADHCIDVLMSEAKKKLSLVSDSMSVATKTLYGTP